MSLLPKKLVEAVVPQPARVPRPTYAWKGITISARFSRRPRVLRLEASKPRGSGVGA